MKHALALLLFCTSTTLSAAVYACNHDILCPTQWVWSDAEGTCVEDPKGTS